MKPLGPVFLDIPQVCISMCRKVSHILKDQHWGIPTPLHEREKYLISVWPRVLSWFHDTPSCWFLSCLQILKIIFFELEISNFFRVGYMLQSTYLSLPHTWHSRTMTATWAWFWMYYVSPLDREIVGNVQERPTHPWCQHIFPETVMLTQGKSSTRLGMLRQENGLNAAVLG